MYEAYQITTYVRVGDVEALLNGICAIYPVRFGNYEGVFWVSSPGVEHFKPLEGASPTQGSIDTPESVSAVAVSFLMPRDARLLEDVIQKGIRPSHPWEEPVIVVNEVFSSSSDLTD